MLTTWTTSATAGARLTRRTGAAVAGAGMLLAALTACGGSDAEPLALEVPSTDVAQMCAELTPEGIATADTAFKGTVTDVTGDVVTLEVDDRYAGEVPEEVTIPQQAADQPSELSMGSLTVGQEYLISAQDGTVSTCGQSGPVSEALEALYEAAYPQ